MESYYNENLIQPYQTVLISFKSEKQFYARLDPKKFVKIHSQEVQCKDFFQQPDAQWYKIQDSKAIPIKDLGELDYNMMTNEQGDESNDSDQEAQESNVAEQFAQKIAFNDKVIQEKLQNSDVFNVRNQFAKHKQAAKVRQKYGNLIKVEIITPYLFSQIKFREIQVKTDRFHFLSGASLGYCAQYLNLVSGSTRILIFDDFDGAATCMVASRLQLRQFNTDLKKDNLLKQINELKNEYQKIKDQILPIIKCLSIKPCTSEELQFSYQQLWETQRDLMLKCVIPVIKLYNIKSPYDTFILQTGQCHSAQLKTAFIDTNLLPTNNEHFEFQLNNYYDKKGTNKQLQTPPCIPTHPGIFFEKDIELSNYCYVGDRDPEYDTKPQFSIYDVINVDYQVWFERRMQMFGFAEFQEVSRLFQLHQVENLWNLGVRRNFHSYLHKDFIEAVLDNKQTSLAKVVGENQTAQKNEEDKKSFQMPLFTFNSAFFAIRSNAVILLRYLLKYIESGAPCVIFSQYQQVLLDLADYIISNKIGLRVGCGEVYEVPQQILPQRTHPTMVAQVNGGYVLKFYVQNKDLETDPAGTKKQNPQKRRGSKLKK